MCEAYHNDPPYSVALIFPSPTLAHLFHAKLKASDTYLTEQYSQLNC